MFIPPPFVHASCSTGHFWKHSIWLCWQFTNSRSRVGICQSPLSAGGLKLQVAQRESSKSLQPKTCVDSLKENAELCEQKLQMLLQQTQRCKCCCSCPHHHTDSLTLNMCWGQHSWRMSCLTVASETTKGRRLARRTCLCCNFKVSTLTMSCVSEAQDRTTRLQETQQHIFDLYTRVDNEEQRTVQLPFLAAWPVWNLLHMQGICHLHNLHF